MSHLDEGTLHALLDGELDAKEVRQIQAHLGSCSACGTRLQSVKDVLSESDRLVGSLQFPGTPRRPAALDPAPEPARRTPPVPETPGSAFEPAEPYVPGPEFEPAAYQPSAQPPRPPERRLQAEPVYDQAPPVLLVPDDSMWAERRRRLLGGLRWAALLVVTIGAGYIASEVRRAGTAVPAATRPAAPELSDAPEPVLGEAEETGRPESLGLAAQRAVPAPPEPAPTTAARDTRPAPPPARKDEAAAAKAAPSAAAEDQQFADTAEPEPAAAGADEAQVEAPTSQDVREEAAEALAELDRRRRAERAAAATAALDAAARRRNAVTRNAAAPAEAAPVPPAPAPRTLEQRSGIYLRIGLDEAARQLGRPVHVIEGMQQQFMGLAQGVASPAADPARPVVRVVYQDSQGRMILLDQQRIRPGQTWAAGETRWVTGEIGLALLGEPGPEVLRNLRPRVR